MFASPTATYLDATLVNVGPVTTAFTPPADCTLAPQRLVGLEIDGAPQWLNALDCAATEVITQCLPSEKAFVSAHSQNLVDQWKYFTYYSPAAACPPGWKTQGVIAASVDGDKTSLSSSGDIFKTTQQSTETMVYQNLPFADYFAFNLQDSETAVFCCPSGFEVGQQGGGCYSRIANTPTGLASSSVCYLENDKPADQTVTSFHHSIWTPPLVSFDKPTAATTVTKAVDEWFSQLELHASSTVVVDYVPPMVLVHKKGEIKDDGSNGDAKGKDDKNNEAKKLGPGITTVLGAALFSFTCIVALL